MRTWLRDLWQAALLRTAVFDGLRRRSDAFLQGFIVIVVVALLVGLPGLVADLARGASVTPTMAESAEQESQALESIDKLLNALNGLGVPAEQRAEIRAWAEVAAAVGAQVGVMVPELPAALPRPIGDILQALGGWLSRPWADGGLPLAAVTLGTWLGYGVWVLLFTRLLGGRGSLQGFFGATALFAAPHILDLLARVPYVGTALRILAVVWGLVVYIKAVAVSQELTFERALLAFLLPAAIVVVLALLLVVGLSVAGALVAVF